MPRDAKRRRRRAASDAPVGRRRRTGPRVRWALGLTAAAALPAIVLALLADTIAWWVLWLACVNLVALAAFWYDKSVARREAHVRHRVPEAALLWICLIGGSPGGIVVMLGRNHKTIDGRFRLGIGVIVGLQMGILGFATAQRLFGGG